MGKPSLIAIVGGSGAGKTWLADQLHSALHPKAARLSLDDFYRDRSHLSPGRRRLINFDHPRAIDWSGFRLVLEDYLAARPTSTPVYDFTTHSRSGTARLERKQILLVDGLWLLRFAWLRQFWSLSIFVDCPAQTRLRRRLSRDLASRGRSRDSIQRQFVSMVEPMHQKYVATQAKWADVLLSKNCSGSKVNQLAERIKDCLP
jgi:uridine kinase